LCEKGEHEEEGVYYNHNKDHKKVEGEAYSLAIKILSMAFASDTWDIEQASIEIKEIIDILVNY
jgi:hypothetical protein